MEYLDLRDLVKELSQLRGMRDDVNIGLCQDDADRLEALEGLETELGGDNLAEYAENEPTMIPDCEFEDYARDFAYDAGFVRRRNNNPLYSFIDWAGWADLLKDDYTEVTFDGGTYLILLLLEKNSR